jgi:serine phosphatase RsbU (regulator of sigma subunit)
VATPADTVLTPGWRFLVGWTTAWAVVGVGVAVGISFGAGVEFGGPVLRLSLLFAQVVGYSAYVSARLVFPLLARLPFALRLVLDSLILLSGTLFGSIVAVLIEPLYLVAQFRIGLLIFAGNTVLAGLVAVSLGVYDRMRRQIEASYSVLRERDALERELGVARDVQRQLLPHQAPDMPGLELAGMCRQAIAVGGDYYDYLRLADGRLGLVIADVSGKGVPAALLMASLQASVRSLFLTVVDPGTLNAGLNDALFRASSAARYATAFLATFDPQTGRLEYSNAGHLPPVLVRRADTVRCEEGGVPIGLFEGSAYDTESQTLASGDLLAMFTDGVTEAPAPDGDEFGSARLADLLRAHRDQPLEEIIETVLEAVAQWSGPIDAHDDVTLVLARVP